MDYLFDWNISFTLLSIIPISALVDIVTDYGIPEIDLTNIKKNLQVSTNIYWYPCPMPYLDCNNICWHWTLLSNNDFNKLPKELIEMLTPFKISMMDIYITTYNIKNNCNKILSIMKKMVPSSSPSSGPSLLSLLELIPPKYLNYMMTNYGAADTSYVQDVYSYRIPGPKTWFPIVEPFLGYHKICWKLNLRDNIVPIAKHVPNTFLKYAVGHKLKLVHPVKDDYDEFFEQLCASLKDN